MGETSKAFWQALRETIVEILAPIRKLMGFGEREARDIGKDMEEL